MCIQSQSLTWKFAFKLLLLHALIHTRVLEEKKDKLPYVSQWNELSFFFLCLDLTFYFASFASLFLLASRMVSVVLVSFALSPTNTVVLLTQSFFCLTVSQFLWLKTSQFFPPSLFVSHCPPTPASPHPPFSLSATVFTWPLHVT